MVGRRKPKDVSYRRAKVSLQENLNISERALPYPSGWLGKALDRISNPKKHRWAKYIRACKQIPETSPLAGCTNFRRINKRRYELIDAAHASNRVGELKSDPEFQAMQKAVSAWICGPIVAANFLMRRELRKIDRAV